MSNTIYHISNFRGEFFYFSISFSREIHKRITLYMKLQKNHHKVNKCRRRRSEQMPIM